MHKTDTVDCVPSQPGFRWGCIAAGSSRVPCPKEWAKLNGARREPFIFLAHLHLHPSLHAQLTFFSVYTTIVMSTLYSDIKATAATAAEKVERGAQKIQAASAWPVPPYQDIAKPTNDVCSFLTHSLIKMDAD